MEKEKGKQKVVHATVLLPEELFIELQKLRIERGTVPLRTLCLQLITERLDQLRES